MSIQNYLNQIKNAVFGKDVRQSIHDAIKQCYDDASINHDNANMEVKLARGSHTTLNDRLNESEKNQDNLSSQLEQSTQQLKGQINEIAEAGTTMEAVQSKVSEMAEHGLIQAYTLADGTVEPKKISFFNTIYGNLFDKKTVVTNKQLNIANGTIGNMTDRIVVNY